jgi:predicted GNAT family acetyltransferase
MIIQTYAEPAEYLKKAQPFLEADEVANNLILGVTIRLKEHPEWIDSPPYLGIIEHEGEVVLVGAITPPYNVLLAGSPEPDPAAIDLLVQNLRQGKWAFPGVNAEKRLAEAFALRWSQVAGTAFTTKMRLRAYELRWVIPPPQLPPGHLRLAEEADLDTVTAWRAAFQRESLHEDPPDNVDELALRFIRAGTTYLWEDGKPVSMAVVTRPTPHGISIGGVYTPPELRGRGYASACVAAVSQRQLDAGRAFCTLFTDLGYPTSNAIYQRIGYQPVCDFAELAFSH